MNKTAFKPAPEANVGIIQPASVMTVYPSRLVPGALSVMLTSDDKYGEIQAVLRLTSEQVETLFHTLAGHLGDNAFDIGYAAGYTDGEREGESGGYDHGYDDGNKDGWNDGYELGFERGIEAGEEASA